MSPAEEADQVELNLLGSSGQWLLLQLLAVLTLTVLLVLQVNMNTSVVGGKRIDYY